MSIETIRQEKGLIKWTAYTITQLYIMDTPTLFSKLKRLIYDVIKA